MPIYEYQGIRKSDGRVVKGLRDAESDKNLRAILKREGVMITEMSEKVAGAKRGEVDFKRLFFNRVSKLDIALTTRQLATLTKAGISLVESLNAIIDQTEKTDLKGAITDVRDQVNQGISLSDAFGRHPKFFDHLFCNMIHAGEQSGKLEQVLIRLADFIEARNKLTSKVVAAMFYPGFMALMGTVIIGIMMVVVVPKVTSIFENFGRALPWYTEALISISNIFTNYWWAIILVIVGSIMGFKKWKNSESGKPKWHKFVLAAPLFGSLAMMIAISRFSKTLSTLLASGVPVLNAMDITKGVLGNIVLEKVIVDAAASIREGESIAEPLKASGRFPPIVTHMISIGERSGQLEEMLENVSNSYDVQVEAKIATMTSMLEPAMIVIMGIGAGSIAAAILMPLIKMNEFVQ